MTSRIEKERVKQIQDKCQNLLTQMLRDEDNKYCVDCDSKGPRWASWNLGIFLCIRCAGIHRNLGVHISKVKSVNLDTWTPEQVVSLQQMGNSRARAVYEANLPDSFRRPQTDCSLESFIRAKYEHKKYIAREWVPAPLPKVNWDKELDEEVERQRRRKKEGNKVTNQNPLSAVKKPEIVPQLPKPKSSVSPKPSKLTNDTAILDLLGLDAPTNQAIRNGSCSGDDIFSSFLSATPSSTTTVNNGSVNESSATKTDEENFFNQTVPSIQKKSKMTRDSILALYGAAPSQQSAWLSGFAVQNTFSTPQIPMTNQINPGQMGMVNSSMGSGMQTGGINPMNGMSSNTMSMQTHMNGVTSVGSQMIPMGQTNIATGNNGWSGMIANPNIQPAPGSNPFFNLPTQTPGNSAFIAQLPQQMGQMSLSDHGKPSPASLPGQTLSNNLWQ